MKLRTIKNTTLETPPLMFGANVFGWTLDETASFRMLDMLLERGYTFLDSADSYGADFGLSETIIGNWMKNRGVRDKMTIATKTGNVKTIREDGSVVRSRNNSRDYMTRALEDSLRRLQTDHIDLYYTHFDDEVTPLEDVLATHQGFIDSGKVRVIGGSNYSAERLTEAMQKSERLNLPRYEIFQTEYNLMERKEFETELREVCERYDLSVATYFSLAGGFLTGKYKGKSDFKGTARRSITEKYFHEQGKSVIQTLEDVAQEQDISVAGAALRWILQRPGVTAAIASATNESHLTAFDEAVEIILPDAAMEKLTKVSSFDASVVKISKV